MCRRCPGGGRSLRRGIACGIDGDVCWWMMTETIPTQEQVDAIARELAPDVVRIRMRAGVDWSEHPAYHFKVILSDDASRPPRLYEVTKKVRNRVFDGLSLSDSERIP